MLLDYPQNCLCGSKPKLAKMNVDFRAPTKDKYVKYVCEKCDIHTFGTQKEEYCRELWNAGVELARKKLNKT
jgi:hypothetical protein